MLWKLFRFTYSFGSSFGALIGIWDPSSAPITWGKWLMSWNFCIACLVSASALGNLIKSLALLIKAEQNSSLTFMAVHRPIPNVNPTVLYEIPVANHHRATATRFSTVIASRRIVFCRINWGPTRPQMCWNVSLLTLKNWKCFVSRHFFKVARFYNLNLLSKRLKFHSENRCQV